MARNKDKFDIVDTIENSIADKVVKKLTPKKLSDEGEQSREEEEARVKSIINQISLLGGKGMKAEDIVYEGTKIVLPTRFTGDLDGVIEYLRTKQEEEEEISQFFHSYHFRPHDGAYNAINAMKKAFGMVHGKTTWSFFGPNRPKYISIPIGLGRTEEIPWGEFTVPLLENTTFTFGSDDHADYGKVFRLTVSTPRKNHFMVNGLFKLISEELEENSIYRGRAIDGQETPQFLDLRGYDDSKVVYSTQVKSDLDANLWSVLRYSEENRALGLPLKRSILLTGPYGTGKSLAGVKTGLEAEVAGWTFIRARPGRDDFMKVMQTARIYQPAVVFMEDAENVANANNEEIITQILDLFDGIESKNTDLVVVLTTNNPKRFHKGMMRPGRLDAIIEIGALDADGTIQLIKLTIGENRLEDNIDWEPIVEAAAGYMPAFIKEMADRAVRYALARSEGNIRNYRISTEDLIFSANGLRSQYQRMEEAPVYTDNDRLGQGFSAIAERASKKALLEMIAKGDLIPEVWDTKEVKELRGNGTRAKALNA